MAEEDTEFSAEIDENEVDEEIEFRTARKRSGREARSLECDEEEDPAGGGDHGRHTRLNMRPETYCGDGSWMDYLSVFNTIANINQWGPREKADYLFTHLRGPARQIACSLIPDEQRDFVQLTHVLTTRFGPGEQAELYLAELRNRRRGRGEGLRELGQSIRKLADLAYPDMTPAQKDRLAKTHFVDALDDTEARMRIYQGKPINLEQTVTLALEVEGFRKIEAGRQEQTSQKHVREVNAIPDQTRLRLSKIEQQLQTLLSQMTAVPRSGDRQADRMSYNRRPLHEIECFFCKNKGHYQSNCPLRQRMPVVNRDEAVRAPQRRTSES